VYSREELKAIADVCKKHDIVIVSDEVYEKLMYDQAQHVSIASVSEDAYKRTVTVNGVSKAYAMTGWRIGYAAANPELVSAMSNIQGHVTTNPTSISQKAAVVALLGPQEPLKMMLNAFRERADYTYKRVNEIPGFFCRKPLGAFYVFPNVAKVFGKTVAGQVIKSADQLCDIFLDKVQVAIVPGSGFGSPDNIRISYATSMEKIVDGLNRVDALLKGAL
jgi:aspartate aminotransferase